MILFVGFGWAKPVPFNPYNLKNPKKDAVHIALAGPFSNLIIAIIAAVALRVLSVAGLLEASSLLPVFLILLVVINLFLLFFNIIPVHPLDGSKLIDAILVKPEHRHIRDAIAMYGPRALMLLVIISIFTSINVFFFISVPSFLACDAMVGGSCSALLSTLF